VKTRGKHFLQENYRSVRGISRREIGYVLAVIRSTTQRSAVSNSSHVAVFLRRLLAYS